MSITPTRRPFEARVIGEKSELDVRIFALNQFIDSPLFVDVDPMEKDRLQIQAVYMKMYSDILGSRIAAFKPVINETPGPRGKELITELNPELAGQAIFKEEVPIGAKPIEDVDTFAMMVDHWHAQCMERGNRILEIPEGTIVQVEDITKPGEVVEMDLNGAYLQVFRIGVTTALEQFKNLPFGASIEEGQADDNQPD